jgi:hypothetical protein
MVQITSRRFSIGGEIPNNDNYAMIAVIGFHHEGHKEPRRLSWEGFHVETQKRKTSFLPRWQKQNNLRSNEPHTEIQPH